MVVPALEGLNSSQNKTFTTTARIDTALGDGDNFVQIYTDTDCYFNLGDSTVSAAVGNVLLMAGDSRIIKRTGFTHVAAVEKT
jgi:hypothetical protein